MFDTLRQRLRRSSITVDFLRTSGLLGAIGAPALAKHALGAFRRAGNQTGILRLHASNTPDRPAVIEALGGRQLTYRELDERVNRLATAMAARGIGRGSRVAIMMRNCTEYIELQWASTRLGAVAVQIGYRLKAAEVAYILENSEPAILFCRASEEPVLREARDRAGQSAPILVTEGAGYDELLAAGDAVTWPRPGGDGDSLGGVMICTSGTTGHPKGAARGFKKELPVAVPDFLRQLKVHHDDRHLCVCPLYHSAAPAFVAFVFAVGGTVYLVEHFEPDVVLDLIERDRITSSFMVPTMLARLAAATEARPRDTSSLRWLTSGAAPLPTETARRVEAAFGPVLYNFYGSTETGLVTVALPGEHTARPGTIGRPLAGNELRLLGEDGADVGPGEIGELYVRNAMLVAGYHRDKAATERAMRDGYFSVGDLARIDADGYVYLTDRKHDMVISGGVNIYPLEIEQRLHEHPAVLEAAVVGVPDDEWGESLKAFVVTRHGEAVSAEELRAFCKETLANFKVPKSIEFLESLPRNPTGKVLKRELRAR
jgi:fatty-acyl-CoA synthase